MSIAKASEDRVLIARRKERLVWYESQLEGKFRSLAALFLELKNDKLQPWLPEFESFEEYAEKKWGMTPRRRQQLERGEFIRLLAAENAPDIAEDIKAMPEGQVRVISKLKPPERIEVIRAAISIQPDRKKRTADTLKIAKARVIDAVIEPEKPACCPTCKRPYP
jgi:hypothetical protein